MNTALTRMLEMVVSILTGLYPDFLCTVFPVKGLTLEGLKSSGVLLVEIDRLTMWATRVFK